MQRRDFLKSIPMLAMSPVALSKFGMVKREELPNLEDHFCQLAASPGLHNFRVLAAAGIWFCVDDSLNHRMLRQFMLDNEHKYLLCIQEGRCLAWNKSTIYRAKIVPMSPRGGGVQNSWHESRHVCERHTHTWSGEAIMIPEGE